MSSDAIRRVLVDTRLNRRGNGQQRHRKFHVQKGRRRTAERKRRRAGAGLIKRKQNVISQSKSSQSKSSQSKSESVVVRRHAAKRARVGAESSYTLSSRAWRDPASLANGNARFFEMLAEQRRAHPDEEMRYLEEKLGLTRGGDEANSKLTEELELDGIAVLTSFIDKVSKRTARAVRKLHKQDEQDEQDEQDSSDPDQDSSDQDSSDQEHYGKNEDSVDAGLGVVVRSSARHVKERSNVYVPPHLRKQNTASSASVSRRAAVIGTASIDASLRKQVKGHVNRLTDANIEPIAGEIRRLFDRYAHTDVITVLQDTLLVLCADPAQIVHSIVASCAALVTSLHIQVSDAHIVPWILEHFVDEFMKRYEVGQGQRNACSNLLLFVAHLYNFQVVHCKLLYDLFRMLAESFSELDIELILLLLRYCGYPMRRDDPTSLKEMILLVQRQAKASNEATDGATSVRVEVMLDMIMDLKNNRKRHADPNAVFEHLKKWLQNVARTEMGGSGISECATRVALDDLRQAKNRGRWWIPGAAWKGASVKQQQHNQFQSQQRRLRHRSMDGDDVDDADGINDGPDVLALARQQRMNTDFRRAVFCVIMSAEDFLDARRKLEKLGIKGTKDREVARIVMDCCAQENKFNRYYALLAQDLCERHTQFKFTFQLAFWDAFKRLDDPKLPPRRVANLAHLLAHLITGHSLYLTMLKVMEWRSLPSLAVLFLHVMFTEIMRLVIRQSATPPSSSSLTPVVALDALLDRIDKHVTRTSSAATTSAIWSSQKPRKTKQDVSNARLEIGALKDGMSYFFFRYLLPSLRREHVASTVVALAEHAQQFLLQDK